MEMNSRFWGSLHLALYSGVDFPHLLRGDPAPQSPERLLMTQNGHARVCPTRIDGRAALFVHKVSKVQCQDRQRGHYHKCYACIYNNAYVAVHGLPTPAPTEEVVRAEPG